MRNERFENKIGENGFPIPEVPSKLKILIFSLEISLILFLLVAWFGIPSIKQSKNLVILFLYNFPSQFLVPIVPLEPTLLYFSKFYHPWVITVVVMAGTILTEALNYSIFKFIGDLRSFQNFRYGKMINSMVGWFKKAPFLTLLFVGFTPAPFYPFRFLVVLARYPAAKYLLAVFLSRTPRTYMYAFLGYIIKIPDYLLGLCFVILLFSLGIPFVRGFCGKRKQKHPPENSIQDRVEFPFR